MLKLLFELLIDPLGLPLSAMWEYVILALIGIVAFKIGWEASPGGTVGSVIHWAVRLLAFFALWAITYGAIAAFKWFIAHWAISLIILAGTVVAVVLVFVVRQKLLTEKTHKVRDDYEQSNI